MQADEIKKIRGGKGLPLIVVNLWYMLTQRNLIKNVPANHTRNKILKFRKFR
jgi:hypothetical protein